MNKTNKTTDKKTAPKLKAGLYETFYGNSAEYSGRGKNAFDLDMGEKIPVEMLTKYIRPL